MNSVKSMMESREEEINLYMDLLKYIHDSTQHGLPALQNRNGVEYQLENTHLHILTASIYMLLYNYIEAVVTQSLNTLICYIQNERMPITQFSEPIQKEWLIGGLNLNDAKASVETRLGNGLKMLKHFGDTQKIDIKISKGGGGNFNDDEIFKLAKKLQVNMCIDDETHRQLRQAGNITYESTRKFQDTCMKEITRERNKLAHGEITFQECGRNRTISDLMAIKDTTFRYMHLFTDAFTEYLMQKKYLKPTV